MDHAAAGDDVLLDWFGLSSGQLGLGFSSVSDLVQNPVKSSKLHSNKRLPFGEM